MKPGNVPTERIAPILYTLIRERWPHGGGMDVLAEKVGCDPGAIAHIIDQTNPGVEFDLADRLLCGLGRYDHWFGELADVYPVMFLQTCELPGCHKRFPEYQRGIGTPVKRFCSRKHTMLAGAVRNGTRPGQLYRQRNRCNRGHALTPENTIRNVNGAGAVSRCCRKCSLEKHRERNLRYRARKREARLATR